MLFNILMQRILPSQKSFKQASAVLASAQAAPSVQTPAINDAVLTTAGILRSQVLSVRHASAVLDSMPAQSSFGEALGMPMRQTAAMPAQSPSEEAMGMPVRRETSKDRARYNVIVDDMTYPFTDTDDVNYIFLTMPKVFERYKTSIDDLLGRPRILRI